MRWTERLKVMVRLPHSWCHSLASHSIFLNRLNSHYHLSRNSDVYTLCASPSASWISRKTLIVFVYAELLRLETEHVFSHCDVYCPTRAALHNNAREFWPNEGLLNVLSFWVTLICCVCLYLVYLMHRFQPPFSGVFKGKRARHLLRPHHLYGLYGSPWGVLRVNFLHLWWKTYYPFINILQSRS